jgi:hypothetical protein
VEERYKSQLICREYLCIFFQFSETGVNTILSLKKNPRHIMRRDDFFKREYFYRRSTTSTLGYFFLSKTNLVSATAALPFKELTVYM